MTLRRCGGFRLLIAALALGGIAGCAAGGPQRASDIQNLNAISDDISSVTMARTDGARVRDPNIHSTIPRTYEIFDTR